MSRFEDIPGRAFLDTSCLNFIVENGEYLFNGGKVPERVTERQYSDLTSFYNIFRIGERAFWQIIVSTTSFEEVWNSSDRKKRSILENWVSEIWIYWNELLKDCDDMPSNYEFQIKKEKCLQSEKLNILPDKTDRILICEAIATLWFGIICFF